eukprot:COSAG01_NODE_1607_length_9744_cov_26.629031_1_plen_63_part_00
MGQLCCRISISRRRRSARGGGARRRAQREFFSITRRISQADSRHTQERYGGAPVVMIELVIE